MPLDVLINILSSARPLHRVLGEYLRRQKSKPGCMSEALDVDPHRRVDTHQFLLQRTRRVSAALNAIRERLERPAATTETLQWRLTGPVGVLALARALIREGRSADEQAFLLSELALELSRVTPTSAPGHLPASQYKAAIQVTLRDLKAMIPPPAAKEPANLRHYIDSVFDTISA